MKKKAKTTRSQRSQRSQSPQETWIINGIIATQDSERRVLEGAIRIVDGRIDSILKSAPKKTSSKARVINAKGLTILPGFVQAHVHLCQTLFRNMADDLELLDWLRKRIWVMEGAHTKETLYTSALLGIHELLSSGTTCILDMGTVRHTESILKAVQETGIRASVGKCLMDHPETTPETLREDTDEALQEAVALYHRWNGTEKGRIRVSYAPRFVISCTQRLLSEVSQKAREQKALVHTHASENQKEVEFVKELVGTDNVLYLHQLGLTSPRLVLAHCIWLTEAEKRILRDTGTHVVHCPSSNLKLASGIAQVPELRSLGVNVALGADGAPCSNNLNMFQEMRLAALIQKPVHGPKAMRAQEVLDMATRDGAKALGWFDSIGSIEEGKRADLIALDLNDPHNTVPPFGRLDPDAIASSVVYACQPADLRYTLVEGEVLFEKGAVTRIPRAKLAQKVEKAQSEIARLTGCTNLWKHE